jgi:hypothetical protein
MALDRLIGQTFVDLADTLVEGYDLIDFLHLLTRRSVALLDVAEAGVALVDGTGTLRPLASSSERMRVLELIELQNEEGPCFDCFQDGGPVRVDDLRDAHHRWPRFAPAALDAGFASVHAVPLRLRNQRIGALNLFSDSIGGLDVADEALGQAMADIATIGILHERVARQSATLAEQLQTALDTRVALEQAKGMICQQAGLEAEAAFALLRNYARHHNRKLSDVVTAVNNRDLAAADLRVGRRVPGTAPVT